MKVIQLRLPLPEPIQTQPDAGELCPMPEPIQTQLDAGELCPVCQFKLVKEGCWHCPRCGFRVCGGE